MHARVCLHPAFINVPNPPQEGGKCSRDGTELPAGSTNSTCSDSPQIAWARCHVRAVLPTPTGPRSVTSRTPFRSRPVR